VSDVKQKLMERVLSVVNFLNIVKNDGEIGLPSHFKLEIFELSNLFKSRGAESLK
jgi:hypothetical protein